MGNIRCIALLVNTVCKLVCTMPFLLHYPLFLLKFASTIFLLLLFAINAGYSIEMGISGHQMAILLCSNNYDSGVFLAMPTLKFE
jgi:hypothetical protein